MNKNTSGLFHVTEKKQCREGDVDRAYRQSANFKMGGTKVGISWVSSQGSGSQWSYVSRNGKGSWC